MRCAHTVKAIRQAARTGSISPQRESDAAQDEPSESICELGQRVRQLLSNHVAAGRIMASWVAGRVS